MHKLKIVSITKLQEKRHIYDLSVQENHNFYVTKKSILTHNCDYLTINAQAVLRGVMEEFSRFTRFILTCNYSERIIEPIISRCQTFEMVPPSKKEVALRVSYILKNENVEFNNKDLAFIINSLYPDIRRIINTCQFQTIGNKLVVNQESIINSDSKLKILEILKNKELDKKSSFKEIRQIVADHSITDFDTIYSLLYREIDSYADGHVAQTILILSEMQAKASLVIDKEINFMSTIIQILNIIKKQ